MIKTTLPFNKMLTLWLALTVFGNVGITSGLTSNVHPALRVYLFLAGLYIAADVTIAFCNYMQERRWK